MKSNHFRFLAIAAAGLIIGAAPMPCLANNLTVSNVDLGTRDSAAKSLVVKFDLAWENSWRNKINHDAVWLTVRLNKTSVSPTHKKLCQLSASGINPSGFSTGTSSVLELVVPSDKAGVFIRRASYSSVGNVSTQNAQVKINYESCGFSDSDEVAASILGIEMVYIPQGAFYAGDNNGSTASLNRGSADSNPWYISSENAISVANPASNGFRYMSNNNAGEYATGATFTIPAAYPKGFNAFYVMKYEITEGQWVEFINSLPSAASRASRDLTDNNHKSSDAVISRNTIACSGSPLICSTQRPVRPVSFLSWPDMAAFLDWAALRPLTELEFEKASRGPVLPVSNEYIWGSLDIAPADALTATEDGTETVTTTGANAHFNNIVLSGGDTAGGTEYQMGPLRSGIFATASSTRISAGASFYAVMELGGNLKERIVTLGNSNGLSFSGLHGDGLLTSTTGFEGNADVSGWPGFDATAVNGITGAAGTGFRGGSWFDVSARLQISDRHEAALAQITGNNLTGGRGARTYDGN